MKGQVAVITGAGHGIGKGIAERFAREGASVVIAEVDENGGRDTENAIQEAGGDALFVHTDVSSERSVRLMLQRTLDRYGTIHTLVNNAGITVFKPLTETTLEDWEQVMNIDLRGVFLCSKLTAPEMIRRGGGADHQYFLESRLFHSSRHGIVRGGEGGRQRNDAEHGFESGSSRHTRQCHLSRFHEHSTPEAVAE